MLSLLYATCLKLLVFYFFPPKRLLRAWQPTSLLSQGNRNYIIIISNLPNDRPKASSKTIPPHSAIYSFLLQLTLSSPICRCIKRPRYEADHSRPSSVKVKHSWSYTSKFFKFHHSLLFNRLTPNDPYMGRTAPLTSKRCILYIYSFPCKLNTFRKRVKNIVTSSSSQVGSECK